MTTVTCWYSKGTYAEELYEEFLRPAFDTARLEGGLRLLPVEGQSGTDQIECYRAKATHLYELTQRTWEPILYVDTDVLFLKPIAVVCAALRGYSKNRTERVFFQDDSLGGLCCGFTFVADPAHKSVQDLLHKACTDLEHYRVNDLGDQAVVNEALYGNKAAFRLPSLEYWNCGSDPELRGAAKRGWRPKSLPSQAVVVHAACVEPQDKAAVLRTYRSLYHG